MRLYSSMTNVCCWDWIKLFTTISWEAVRWLVILLWAVITKYIGTSTQSKSNLFVRWILYPFNVAQSVVVSSLPGFYLYSKVSNSYARGSCINWYVASSTATEVFSPIFVHICRMLLKVFVAILSCCLSLGHSLGYVRVTVNVTCTLMTGWMQRIVISNIG